MTQFNVEDLVGISDIAKMLNWTNSKVSEYVRRGVLPQPVGKIGGRPVFLESQVETFIKQRNNKN